MLPVAFECHEHRQLVPQVPQSGRVVGQWLREDPGVGNVNHAPGALVGLHPVADLHEGELEHPAIDDVPRVWPDLNAIPCIERPPRQDEHPSREVRHDVLERDRQARGEQPQEGAQGTERGEPDQDQHEQSQRQRHVARDLVPPVLHR